MSAERTLRAGLGFVSGFAVGYLLPATLRLPVPTYYPALRAVHLGAGQPGISMRYYGDFLVACTAGLAWAALAWKLAASPAERGHPAPLRKSNGSVSPIPVATATALSLIALDLAWYLSRLLAAV